jgi:excisionase family DNA binding protein
VSETPIHHLLTVKETAEYLRIPVPTVYYLVNGGKIPAIQIGGRWRIKKSSLDRDILRQDKQGQPTVLVVDDDPGLQDLFRTFLKEIGFSRVVVGTLKRPLKASGSRNLPSEVVHNAIVQSGVSSGKRKFTYVNAVAPQVYASEHENLRKDRFDHRLGHFGELLVSLSLLAERRLK